jgi:hypothetical protein
MLHIWAETAAKLPTGQDMHANEELAEDATEYVPDKHGKH